MGNIKLGMKLPQEGFDCYLGTLKAISARGLNSTIRG